MSHGSVSWLGWVVLPQSLSWSCSFIPCQLELQLPPDLLGRTSSEVHSHGPPGPWLSWATDLHEPLRLTWTSPSLVARSPGSTAAVSVSKGRKQKLPGQWRSVLGTATAGFHSGWWMKAASPIPRAWWNEPPLLRGSRKATPHWKARGMGHTAIVSHFWNTRSTTHSFVINLQWSYPAADKFPFSHCYSVLNWAQSNIQFIPPNICQGYICSLNSYQSIPFYTFKGYSIFFLTWTFYFLLGYDHEFEQTPGDSGEQRSLGGYSPWGHKESDTT